MYRNVFISAILKHNFVLGIGGDLCVFDVSLQETVYRKNVLGSRTVHGICSNSDVSFIAVYGGKNIAILEHSYEGSVIKYI